MILPVRRSGTRPPFFLVHGLYGVLSHTAEMGQALGPDQPFFPIFARGVDGREPACETVAEMVSTYLQEIRDVAPTGPYFVGGQCAGGLLAIDIARTLADEGAQIAGVLLIDPPALPFGGERDRAGERSPRVLQQLYDNALDSLRRKTEWVNLPFDFRDPRRMHIAATVAVLTAVALSGYQPQPFAGPVELIVSAKRAPAYFQPDLPWQKILTGSRRLHVLPGDHFAMARAEYGELLRLLRFVLDGAAAAESEQARPLAHARD